jgi:prepilin-type N-terminal cleavage/methylation domain-containing protein
MNHFDLPWAGLFTASLCPFRSDESIDEEGLSASITALAGADAITCHDEHQLPAPLAAQPMSRRAATRPRVAGFTLLELLVVITIITLLIALLMPALSKARDSATRVSCSSDRRQFGISLVNFATEHKDLMPQATAFKDANGYYGREMSDEMAAHGSLGSGGNLGAVGMLNGFGNQLYENANNGICWPLGTLARQGYVPDPRVFFCPGFNRLGLMAMPTLNSNFGANGITLFWETPQSPGWANWQTLSSGSLTMLYGRFHMGVSQMFAIASYPGNLDRTEKNIHLSAYADRWKSENDMKTGVSAILMACANYSGYRLDQSPGYPSGVPAAVAKAGLSHEALGVNGLFYDGSVRWISREKVMSKPYYPSSNPINGGINPPLEAYMFNQSASGYFNWFDNFVCWARVNDGQ